MTSPSCSSTRFSIIRENFGDLRTFKADKKLLIFAWIFRTYWPKMGVFFGREAKWGKGWCDVDPPTNSFLIFGVLKSVQILVKIDKEMRP